MCYFTKKVLNKRFLPNRKNGWRPPVCTDENEPLTDGAPMIYTPKQAGVRDDCNVRTDKWTLAMNAMDRVNNYKLNEYLKKGEAETPKAAEGQAEGEATEPNPTRDN